MRYPTDLRPGGTIGFIAPSFGCAIEPYQTRFENALRIFREMGYQVWLGPNCYEGSGIGISNTPELCAKELNEAMTETSRADVIITCGGGELMCEVVPYIDFERIKNSPPKWYMGYSDNTNYTFLSAILADTAAIYGPCAPAFGRTPWHVSIEDAMHLLTGQSHEVSGYERWEHYIPEEEDAENGILDKEPTEPTPDEFLKPYQVNERNILRYYLPNSGEGASTLISGDELSVTVQMEGRLLGGCVDILTLLIGTSYDKVDVFLEKYKEDGFIWFLESCDLTMLSIRRAFWQMREAGWFRYVKGFMIGRPLHYGEEQFGVDQYNAVLDMIGSLGVPVIMDLDIGHLPPMMPLVCGSYAKVEAEENHIHICHEFI